MSYSTVLVSVDGLDGSGCAVETAFGLAKRFGSHLTALHVRPDPKDTIPLLGEGMSVAMIEDMVRIADEESEDRSHRAREKFDACVSKLGFNLSDQPGAEPPSASWREERGREDDIAARFGRLSDLIVACRPGAEADVSQTLMLNSALFDTGRAVLVVPPQEEPKEIGRRVVISWNGSAQAARAIGRAMPLLQEAEDIMVFTVGMGTAGADQAHDLANYLAWHGISSSTRALPGKRSVVGADLLEEAKEFNADLLVMGAYTHSRMRQLILGGVTRHVLEQAELPLLMAH
jgi:nucleotide-binding universal stress UspA family protein